MSSESHGRIVLVRHARSAHIHTGWIDAAGFRAWRAAYEAAGIHDEEAAPDDLQQLARRSDLLLASDAPRAIATANLLAPDREVISSPLLRELDLEAPALGLIQLPLLGWGVAVGGRAAWLTMLRRYPSAPETARLQQAMVWLDALAQQHPLIVAVTHASFRRQLARRLEEGGWSFEPGRRTFRHWSAWILERRVDRQ
jgi:broad specificity phosphatase PhoE